MNRPDQKKSTFGIFRPVWDLDALLFWSIFTTCTILMLWLLTNTTKTLLTENVYQRIVSLTNMTAATISPQLYERGHTPLTPNNIEDIALDHLQAVQDQNPDILALALLQIRQGRVHTIYATRSKLSVAKLVENPATASTFTTIVRAAQQSNQTLLSEWHFLFNNTVPLLTDRTTKPEYSFKAVPGWRSTNSSDIPVVVIAFNAPEIQKQFIRVDDNNSTVMAVAILIATILGIFVRWRSMQRIQATQERLDLLEQMRLRDAILSEISTSADELLKQPMVEKILDQMVRRIGNLLQVRSCYATLQKLDSARQTETIVLGELPKKGKALTHAELEKPGLEDWKAKLEAGNPAIGTVDTGNQAVKEFLQNNGFCNVVIIPIFFETRQIGLLTLDDESPQRLWESAILDSLKLAADLFGASYARREQERRLREGSKMQALGRMAGGVAHEFNNLLHIIAGNLNRFLKDPDRPPQDHALAAKMMEASHRGSRIVEQLLHATRQSTPEPGPGSLNDIIQKTTALFHPAAKKDFKLELNLAEDLPVILLDEIQIQQVILNLLFNAVDALGTDGIIRIRSGLTLISRDNEPRRHVYCEVIDNGSGIPLENLDRIFDPFFTTKAAGSGSGLGLSTSRGILEQHGGFIESANRPGGGARFTFYLPVPEHLPQPAGPAASGRMTLPLDGKILIADDEPLCRDVLCTYLDELGLSYVAAKDGRELLKIAAEQAELIKWVVTDWSMPGPDGPALVKELRQLLPLSRIIVVSGFALNTGDIPEIDRLVQKPFTPDQLFQALKNLADGN